LTHRGADGTGFRIGTRLAIGCMRQDLAEAGPAFEIEILGERRTATLTPTPFYDPDNTRLRG